MPSGLVTEGNRSIAPLGAVLPGCGGFPCASTGWHAKTTPSIAAQTSAEERGLIPSDRWPLTTSHCAPPGARHTSTSRSLILCINLSWILAINAGEPRFLRASRVAHLGG